MTNVNNPMTSEPRTFFQDDQGQYFDENPYFDGLKKPKRFALTDIARLAKFEDVQIVQAVEPELTGQIQVEVMRQAHLRSIGLSE